MSNAQLEAKFRDQAVAVLPAATVERLIAQCWTSDELDGVGDLFS